MAFSASGTPSTIQMSKADIAKPLGAAAIISVGAVLIGGFQLGDALRVGAVAGGASYLGEMGAGYLVPRYTGLRGVSKSMAQNMLEAGIAGGAFAYVRPLASSRSYRVGGMSPFASDFIAGASADLGANYAYQPVRSLLG